ncbi:MAG: hypothetical protein JWQ09_1348 [Segetibacter sp.]|nr:hypothetical protein [Segetibacter sp.]
MNGMRRNRSIIKALLQVPKYLSILIAEENLCFVKEASHYSFLEKPEYLCIETITLLAPFFQRVSFLLQLSFAHVPANRL